MGTWGIAKDMANRNAENLARLSKSRGVYKEYVKHGSSGKNIYQYNESTPEILESIRATRIEENKRIMKKQILIGLFCSGLFIALIWILLYY